MADINPQSAHKVTAAHLVRAAYLYIRQSTLHQVLEHQESTQRQYALRERAMALGWPAERIFTIDNDQAESAAAPDGRSGFQKLVAAVSLGEVGIVLGLEVSRLGRNNSDWYRLLEICALTNTLLLDEDGIYDPVHFNDRLLLGLKGTMSEAELHVMQARLLGGLRNKAARGELKTALPVGFVYNDKTEVILDPDQQVQETLRYFFETFRRVGSAGGVARHFREKQLRFPGRIRRGARQGELIWAELDAFRVVQILKNPRYAGAFFFGRTRWHRQVTGKGYRTKSLPSEEWHSLILDAHPGTPPGASISRTCKPCRPMPRPTVGSAARVPPREGPALLQGLVICGRCGNRMYVHYHTRDGKQLPTYRCQRYPEAPCQRISGANLEEAVSELLLTSVTPLALQVALQVDEELKRRSEEMERLRRKEVERYRYEADLAQRRYMQVDPENRLVASTLEADWNDKLRSLTAAQQRYQQQRAADEHELGDEQRKQILALATDFPNLWQDPRTPDRERKRMVRLMLEDVTLLKDEQVTAHVRFKGGATETVRVPVPPNGWQKTQTDPRVLQLIDELLDAHTEAEVADILNERGLTSGTGRPFTRAIVARIRLDYKLKDRCTRLREGGMLILQEMAARLHITPKTVKKWRRRGLLHVEAGNNRGVYLYMPPDEHTPKKWEHKAKHTQRGKNVTFET